jgi:hypothetical protein
LRTPSSSKPCAKGNDRVRDSRTARDRRINALLEICRSSGKHHRLFWRG